MGSSKASDSPGLLGTLLAAVVGAAGVALIVAAKTAPEDFWQPLMLEVGAGAAVFVALQLLAPRKLGVAGIVALCAIGVGLEVMAAVVSPGYWRSLGITLGIGVLLFLALDLLLVRYLLVRALTLQQALRRIRPVELDVAVELMADDQQAHMLRELIDEYDGHNPFNPFAGLGAPGDWERQVLAEEAER